MDVNIDYVALFENIINGNLLNNSDERVRQITRLFNKYGVYGSKIALFCQELQTIDLIGNNDGGTE